MIKRSVCAILLVLVCFSGAFTQDITTNALTTKNEWSSGSVLTVEGKELKGSVKYNDRLGILDFDDSYEAKSFSPHRVTAFEFYDATSQRQRLFYSLEYEDPNQNIRKPFFFEVLKDFKSFAILCKVEPVKIDERTNLNPATGMPRSTTTEITHVEIIYFLDENGKIEPYVQGTRRVVDRELFDSDKKKNKFIDKDLVMKYFTTEEIRQMTEYAEKNALDFRVKDDFIEILNFYEELRAKDKD